jgi:hypothetical protein
MKTEIIKFHESEIIALQEGADLLVAVKPICDAIGLNYSSAYTSIKNDEILGGAYAIRHTHDSSGRVQEMICLSIQHMHGWLFGIQTSKVKPEVRERLLIYKRECYQVLFEHFYGKNKNINANIQERHRLTAYKAKLNKLINKIMARHDEVKKRISALDNENYKQLGLFNK